MQLKAFIKWAIITLVISLLVLLNYSYLSITPEEIRNWILSFGWFAPVLYILLCVTRPMVLFPFSVIALAGGLAFGAIQNTLLVLVGTIGGAALSFLLARKLDGGYVEKQWSKEYQQVQKLLKEKALYYVMLLRIIPLLNFDIISYLAGISKVALPVFILGTMLGMFPKALAYSIIGASLVEGNWINSLLAITFLLIVMAASVLIGRKWKQTSEEQERPVSLQDNRPTNDL